MDVCDRLAVARRLQAGNRVQGVHVVSRGYHVSSMSSIGPDLPAAVSLTSPSRMQASSFSQDTASQPFAALLDATTASPPPPPPPAPSPATQSSTSPSSTSQSPPAQNPPASSPPAAAPSQSDPAPQAAQQPAGQTSGSTANAGT